MQKTCKHCDHTLDVEHFAPSPVTSDGYSRYCAACVARSPALSRALCLKCNSTRSLRFFPDENPARPCLKCSAEDVAQLPLDVPQLRHSDQFISASELLLALGHSNATRSDVMAANRWLRQKGYAVRYCGNTKLFGVAPAATAPAAPLLDVTQLQPHDKHISARELLLALGRPEVSRSDVIEANALLQQQGYSMRRQGSTKLFGVCVRVRHDDTFSVFETVHPRAVERMHLDPVELKALRNGAQVSHVMRLAMSAALIELPAYGGGA